MATRLMVMLTADEAEALAFMAEKDLRDPRDHLRYLLRKEAYQRALLPIEGTSKHEEEQDGKTATTCS